MKVDMYAYKSGVITGLQVALKILRHRIIKTEDFSKECYLLRGIYEDVRELLGDVRIASSSDVSKVVDICV